MKSNLQNTPAEPISRWPYATLFLLGTFGTKDAAGRRLHGQFWIGFTALAATAVLAVIWRSLAWLPVTALALLCPGIAYASWRYISSLDELTRRLQLEAMAVTYLIGFAIFGFLGALGLRFNWNISPLYFVFLEPIRGTALVVLARRYK